jgi:uracil-DNA glycosylase family 4
LRARAGQRAAGGLADTARTARDQGLAPVQTKGSIHRLNCNALQVLRDDVVACERCPRLRRYCEEVARVRRRAYLDQEYWGRPVPPFGGCRARLLIVGLAPGAHGANRTGRMFTGDRSGDWLYRALYQTGFAAKPTSVSRDDGQRLIDAYITAVIRCAPPGNKPLPGEIRNCRPYMMRELDILENLRVVVALGKIAFDNYLAVLRERGEIRGRAGFAFGHNLEFETGRFHSSRRRSSP